MNFPHYHASDGSLLPCTDKSKLLSALVSLSQENVMISEKYDESLGVQNQNSVLFLDGVALASKWESLFQLNLVNILHSIL